MQQRGFTLIELLVVIAIIGILSAVGLVSLNGAREKARDVQARTDLATFKTALLLYSDDNNFLFPGNVTACSGDNLTGTSTPDSSALHDGTAATPNSVWDSGGPILPEQIPSIKAPTMLRAYTYSASKRTAGATSGAHHYVLSYQLEGMGGTSYYSLDDTGTVKDTRDNDTTPPNCTCDTAVLNGVCEG